MRLAGFHGGSRGYVSHTRWVERRAGHARRPPDHAGLAAGIPDDLLSYLISSLVSEGSGEDEDDLVLGGSVPFKDVLQHSRWLHSREGLSDLLAELALHCVQCVLAEFDVTAERPVKQRSGRVGVLSHQQRAVASPLDHCHCFDDLTSRLHVHVVSQCPACRSKALIDGTISLGIYRLRSNMGRGQHFGGFASDRETPSITRVNGPLMARLGQGEEAVTLMGWVGTRLVLQPIGPGPGIEI